MTPISFFTALTVSSGSEPMARRRCGVIGPLNRVRGALVRGASSGASSAEEPGSSAAARSAVRRIIRMPGTLSTPGRASRLATAVAARPRQPVGGEASPVEPGPRASNRSARPEARDRARGGTSRPSGCRSSRTARISLPDTPSMAEWWNLVSIASRPPSSPWIRYSSHGGASDQAGEP